jgi:hypothetical protein
MNRAEVSPRRRSGCFVASAGYSSTWYAREGGGKSNGVVVGGILSGTSFAVMSTRVPPSTAVTSQVMVIVPAKAGSSETKSTSWTTRTSGTTSTKRASTMSESALALPRPEEHRRWSRPIDRRRPAADRVARTWQSFPQEGAKPRALRDRRRRHRPARSGRRQTARHCPCAAPVDATCRTVRTAVSPS